MKPKLLCILGETASGKDSITNTALEKLSMYNIRKVCSYTDRPIRDNETNGVEHYFLTTDEFNHLKDTRKDDILAYTLIKNPSQENYNGYQYMSLNDELGKAHIYIIDYLGVKYLKEKYNNDIDLVLIYIYAPLATRLERAKANRSDFNTEFEDRVKAEFEQFNEFRQLKLYDYKIDNTDGEFENSVNKLCEIINCELLNVGIPNMPILKP